MHPEAAQEGELSASTEAARLRAQTAEACETARAQGIIDDWHALDFDGRVLAVRRYAAFCAAGAVDSLRNDTAKGILLASHCAAHARSNWEDMNEYVNHIIPRRSAAWHIQDLYWQLGCCQ